MLWNSVEPKEASKDIEVAVPKTLEQKEMKKMLTTILTRLFGNELGRKTEEMKPGMQGVEVIMQPVEPKRKRYDDPDLQTLADAFGELQPGKEITLELGEAAKFLGRKRVRLDAFSGLIKKFHNEMAAKSVIITQSLKYIDSNRKALKKQYPTFDKFFTDYEIPQSYIDTVIKAAEKENIKPKDDEELKQTMPMLRMQLKALVARDIWDMSEYFHIINESSEFVQKALEVLR